MDRQERSEPVETSWVGYAEGDERTGPLTIAVTVAFFICGALPSMKSSAGRLTEAGEGVNATGMNGILE